MVSSVEASQRDEVLRQARQLVGEDPVRFNQAGARLDACYSEQYVLDQQPEETGFDAVSVVEMTPERMRFMRLAAAVHCFRLPDQHRNNNHLDYERSGKLDDRLLAARMAVLVMLAAADPDKDEVVTEHTGYLASIPYEITRGHAGEEQLVFGGSCWIPWAEDGWEEPNEPSPRLLERLERAIEFLRQEPSGTDRQSRVPSGDGRPCDQAGVNRFDEAERSLRDVQRYVGHFYSCVNHWRAEWHYRYEDSTRQELNEIKIDNRVWWAKWSGVRTRAIEAIRAIDRPELAQAKQKAFDALAIIAEQYQEPLLYLDDESPGDHLLREARRSVVDEHLAERRGQLAQALDDLQPLMRGCLLCIEEPEPVTAPQAPEQVEAKPRKGKRTESQRRRDEAKLAIFLSEHPNALREDAAAYIGVSEGTISNTAAWKRCKREQDQARRESRPEQFEDFDSLADPESAKIRNSEGARAPAMNKIKASNARRN